jgi:hypothetical protein
MDALPVEWRGVLESHEAFYFRVEFWSNLVRWLELIGVELA